MPNARVIKLWHALHRANKTRPQPGAQLQFADGQVFTLAKMLRFGKGRKLRVAYRWQSHCMICGAPYAFNKYASARSMIRTCPAHRGAYATPRPARRPKERKARVMPIRAALLDAFASYALLGAPVAHGDLIDAAAMQLADTGQHDTRRQRTARALRNMIDNEALPHGVALGADCFTFD